MTSQARPPEVILVVLNLCQHHICSESGVRNVDYIYVIYHVVATCMYIAHRHSAKYKEKSLWMETLLELHSCSRD